METSSPDTSTVRELEAEPNEPVMVAFPGETPVIMLPLTLAVTGEE